ncbi:MAG: carboxypeptidase-like regulatory domain-containing protein [Acidobacteriota bacterium]
MTAVLAAAVACDKNPTAPSGVTGSGSGTRVTLQTLAIGGLRPLEHPGQVLQLTATGTFSDGSTRDVTTQVSWLSYDSHVVSLQADGQLTATGYGTTDIIATYPSTGGLSTKASARVMPEGMFLVRGVVWSGLGAGVANVAVSVTLPDGAVIRTTTDEAGTYRLAGRGDVVVRAEKTGYSPEERSVTVNGDVDVPIELNRLADADSIAGSYTLVFTAASSCTLPAEVMRRQYIARIYEPDKLQVELSGADMEAWGWAGFTGTRDGNSVHFDIIDSYSSLDEDFVFVERLDPQHNLGFSGTATGRIEGGAIVAEFNGRVQLRSVTGLPVFSECRAPNHRLEFAKREAARRR